QKQKDKLMLMKEQYSKAEASVDRITKELENHQVVLLKDIAMFDQMYELNLKYYKELTMYIIAGKKRLEEMRTGELEDLRKKAEQSGLAEDAQKYNDMVSLCNRFEKKLHDLELTRMVSLQMGPQTRMLQNNDTLMVEKIQSSLVNTIPLWKSQMVLALGMEHSRQATAAQNAVTEATNDLLKKNADMLKMGTIATAKEAERSIIDIETLQHTNEQLISTLDEVIQIQRDGAQKRKEAELELGRIEGELKQKLMELRSK
ncbi:MAG: toxic anion resistance protein, partial [Ruminococcaceae bacterium]|nr:toxic anion resistance protein [Oscillospiraceae bacterium]